METLSSPLSGLDPIITVADFPCKNPLKDGASEFLGNGYDEQSSFTVTKEKEIIAVDFEKPKKRKGEFQLTKEGNSKKSKFLIKTNEVIGDWWLSEEEDDDDNVVVEENSDRLSDAVVSNSGRRNLAQKSDHNKRSKRSRKKNDQLIFDFVKNMILLPEKVPESFEYVKANLMPLKDFRKRALPQYLKQHFPPSSWNNLSPVTVRLLTEFRIIPESLSPIEESQEYINEEGQKLQEKEFYKEDPPPPESNSSISSSSSSSLSSSSTSTFSSLSDSFSSLSGSSILPTIFNISSLKAWELVLDNNQKLMKESIDFNRKAEILVSQAVTQACISSIKNSGQK